MRSPKGREDGRMRDFSLDIYRELLESLQAKGYRLIAYEDYIRDFETSRFRNADERYAILRHDVDKKPENSVRTAQIEKAVGARATYYFRTGEDGCYRNSKLGLPEAVRAITALGHEIGYHYEDMSLCGGDTEKAWGHFQTWLDYFRQFYAVETACMHGAPTSRWDSKDLWKKYDYKSLGIIGEPYIDTDFSDVFYLTDTGRCWDGYRVSVRDKIPQYQEEWTRKGWSWHTTKELLQAVEENRLPDHVMMTTHPQRWTNHKTEWCNELIMQRMKNIIKKLWIKN